MAGNNNIDQIRTNPEYDLNSLYGNWISNTVDSLDDEQVELDTIINADCHYYCPNELASYKNNLRNKISVFHINCQSINAHWDELHELICNIGSQKCSFDVIGLSEVFKIHQNINYDIDGYHPIEYKICSDENGRGGVAMYVKNSIDFKKRDDLSVFIPHVIETIFMEIRYSHNEVTIVGTIYRPNTQPLADLDIFLTSIKEVTEIIHNEGKKMILMGDFNIDLLKVETH